MVQLAACSRVRPAAAGLLNGALPGSAAAAAAVTLYTGSSGVLCVAGCLLWLSSCAVLLTASAGAAALMLKTVQLSLRVVPAASSAVAAAFIVRQGRGPKDSSPGCEACEDLYVASVDGLLMRYA